jgi:hypothetical protein
VAAQLFGIPEGVLSNNGTVICRISCSNESQPCGGGPERYGLLEIRDRWVKEQGPQGASLACGRRANGREGTRCGRWMFAYDYRRGGVLRSLKCGAGRRDCLTGQSGHNPTAKLLVELFLPFWGGRVTELVRFRNCVIVSGRSRPAWLTSPNKCLARPKSKIAAAAMPGLRHHRTFTSFLSISCPQDVTSNSMS